MTKLPPASNGNRDEEAHRLIPVQPSPKRIRGVWNGETVVDSTRALLAWDTLPYPFYYFPVADVRMEMLVPAEATDQDARRGEIVRFDLSEGAQREQRAAWRYDPAAPAAAALRDHVSFRWDAMDHWYEEDVEVFVHARDPYNRVDVLDSRRRIQVRVGGEVVADSTHSKFLFETGWVNRYYLPLKDIRQDLLIPSERVSNCPYKGRAIYRSVRIGGKDYPDIVWSYPDPVRESAGIKDLWCFYNEQVEGILVDGEPAPTKGLAKAMMGGD